MNPHDPTPPPWADRPTYVPGQPRHETRRKSWPARHKVLTAVLAVLGVLTVLGGLGAALGGGTTPASTSVATRDAGETGRGTPDPYPTAVATTAAAKPPARPKLTAGQEQAIGAAKDYLNLSGFSRAGLIEQLSSQYGDKFTRADATYAVDYLRVSWRDQAVRSARSYLELSHLSRAGLIQQLSSAYGAGFTRAEATYAADKVGL